MGNNKMRFASFFAGIGGFDLGFQQAGMEPVFHCEIDPYCQTNLKRHWSEVPLHGDIKTLNPKTIPQADLWSAGWPCQDLSHANAQREGIGGARSGLFFRFAQLARKLTPKWIVLENVAGLLSADGGQRLNQLSTNLKRSGIWGSGLRATFSARAFPTIEKEYSLWDVISPTLYTNSILTAANCLGIIRRERRNGRGGKMDPLFRKSLFQTLRFWFNVAEASGLPRQEAIAPRYVPGLAAIKAGTRIDQFYVARNLTWNECEKLMGFPEGWTAAEGDSLATR